MKRDVVSKLMIIAGILFLLCAGAWTVRNCLLQEQAGAAASASLEALVVQMPEPVVREPAQTPVSELELTVIDPAVPLVVPDYLLNPGMEMPVQEVDGVAYIGYLEFPTLGLTLPVCSETTEWQLKLAPCRFSGSVYENDLVIGGHNYTTHFGSLGTLKYGDVVTFTDVDGNVFQYEVIDFETLQPNQAGDLCAGDWDLTLYTCTFHVESRLVVRCARLEP